MNSSGTSDRQTSAPHGSHRDCSSGFAVDAHGLRKISRAGLAAYVADIGRAWIAVKVDQMEHARSVHDRLRLHAAFRALDYRNKILLPNKMLLPGARERSRSQQSGQK